MFILHYIIILRRIWLDKPRMIMGHKQYQDRLYVAKAFRVSLRSLVLGSQWRTLVVDYIIGLINLFSSECCLCYVHYKVGLESYHKPKKLVSHLEHRHGVRPIVGVLWIWKQLSSLILWQEIWGCWLGGKLDSLDFDWLINWCCYARKRTFFQSIRNKSKFDIASYFENTPTSPSLQATRIAIFTWVFQTKLK